jgi:methionine sulfoxide reductase heme-binding subunit
MLRVVAAARPDAKPTGRVDPWAFLTHFASAPRPLHIRPMRRPTHTSTLPNGWPVVGWASLAILAMVGVLLATYGADEAGIRVVIRATARSSFGFFLAAFVASALRRAWHSSATAWVLANRRYLGVSFAVSHFVHLLAIFALYHWSAREFLVGTGATVTALGGLGYVFVFAMAATSFDRSAAWLGRRRWRILHTTGMYYLWFIFTVSYVPRAATSPTYAPLALLALGALAFRLTYRPERTRRTTLATA